MIPDDYDARIRTLRIQLIITQAELASLLGVHERTVQDWERRLAHPKIANWRAFVKLEERTYGRG
jgi:DNA-binding transcriptional regulator YiaG